MLRVSAPGMAVVTGVSTAMIGLIVSPASNIPVVLKLAVALFTCTSLPFSLLECFRLLVLVPCSAVDSLVPPSFQPEWLAIHLYGVQQYLFCALYPAKTLDKVRGIRQM